MELPIDIVPDNSPPRFRWQQTVHSPDGPRIVECSGQLPPGVDVKVESLIQLAKDTATERDKLQAFKDWIHTYLDRHGVPHHPPGPHGTEGCRIGDRMDWLMAQIERVQAAQVGDEEVKQPPLLPPTPSSLATSRNRSK